MFTVILKFDDKYLSYESILEILEENPLKGHSLGSLVWMKKSQPWLDYGNLHSCDIVKLLDYLETKNNPHITTSIYWKNIL